MDDRWMLCTCLGEHYAIHLRWAQEIIYRPQLLSLPGLEPPLGGLIIWQGRAHPVIALRLLAGSAAPAPHPAVVMLGADGQQAGLLVDDIGETLALASADLFPLSPVLTSGRPYLAQGAMLTGGIVFVIDVPALLLQLSQRTAPAAALVPRPTDTATH